MEIILFLALLSLLMVVINCLTIRVIKDVTTRIPGKISILIPMRNEEQNVRGCLTSALNQQGLDDYEVLVLDDNSTDKTSQEIRSFRQVKLIAGSQPPDNWLGKLWACHQLSQESRGDYLVFLDADVRLSRNAVASSISSMKNWDFISPYPRQLTSSFVERIFQPLLQWSWLASVPLIIAQKFSIKSMAVANGQFLIVKRDAYLKAGGHEAVKGEVLDDLMLARQLLSKGFKGGVAEASQVASCQMYQGAQALIRGYRKSLWKAFGSLLGSFVAILLLALTGLIPIIFALTGSELGLIAFLFVFLSRVLSSLRTGSLPNTAILHPVSIILLIALIIYSWIGRFTNTLTWRDRSLT
jgi:glycosyltransferase involved in cell wall biosynthesis